MNDDIAQDVIGRNQIIFKGNKYNWHRDNLGNMSVYRCIYRNKHKCMSEITIQKPSHQVFNVTEHICQQFINADLTWNRKEAIKEFIIKTGLNH